MLISILQTAWKGCFDDEPLTCDSDVRASGLHIPLPLSLHHLHHQIVDIRLQYGILGRELVDVGLDAMHARHEG